MFPNLVNFMRMVKNKYILGLRVKGIKIVHAV